jgi:hypothetical protein
MVFFWNGLEKFLKRQNCRYAFSRECEAVQGLMVEVLKQLEVC